MTTDNRANEPTEAQIEAAAKEYAWNGSMRAALVAAQGAAPQDERSEEWQTWCREESCVHRHWRSGGMPTHRRGDDCPTPGDHAPVLPSSTVDEGALAGVIEEAQEEYFRFDLPENGMTEAREIARAVAEWLKEQGGESRG